MKKFVFTRLFQNFSFWKSYFRFAILFIIVLLVLAGCNNGNSTVFLSEWFFENDSSLTVTLEMITSGDEPYTTDTSWSPYHLVIGPGQKKSVRNGQVRNEIYFLCDPNTVTIEDYVQGSYTIIIIDN